MDFLTRVEETTMSEDKTATPIDIIEFATRLRAAIEPLMDELPNEPPTRLASVVVAAALAIPADGRAFEVAVVAARKVLSDYAAKGRSAGPLPTEH